MKISFLRAAALSAMLGASAVTLAACDATQVSAEINQITQQVQAYVAAACSVVPDAAAVTAIVSSSAGDSVAQIGAAICAALGHPIVSGRLRGAELAKPLVIDPAAHTVNGIQITAVPVAK